MKNKNKNLDVDIIGGEGALTLEEEKAISEYLKQRKLSQNNPITNGIKTTKRTKTTS